MILILFANLQLHKRFIIEDKSILIISVHVSPKLPNPVLETIAKVIEKSKLICDKGQLNFEREIKMLRSYFVHSKISHTSYMPKM